MKRLVSKRRVITTQPTTRQAHVSAPFTSAVSSETQQYRHYRDHELDAVENTDELVIVPAWQRPDFLYAALARLRATDDGARRYWICLDRGYASECLRVAEDFHNALAGRVRIKKRTHRYYGNSCNLLTSYAEAARSSTRIVHLVEEDIFIADDYFDFHRRAHELCPGAFAVSACRDQVRRDAPVAYDDAVYLADRYQSLGVSFKTPMLRDYVVQHARLNYFAQQLMYCVKMFPSSRIGKSFTEQDGLLNRIVEAHDLWVAYPCTPRAYHAGFVGYNRLGDVLSGSPEECGAQLLSMSGDELNARARSYPDHTTTSLAALRAPITRVLPEEGTIEA